MGLYDLASLESSEVLKGSYKTGSMRTNFPYLRPRDALQIQKCIFWEVLCIKMQDFCVSRARPVCIFICDHGPRTARDKHQLMALLLATQFTDERFECDR